MYRTCLFCRADLGDNDIIEALPIGRRLAFDQAAGRLWVVCRKCERWNLTPFDERWEAIEACERAYRNTPRRFATEEIGLARLPEGLELVRIGKPLRPEFAAWRYGDQFGRRRRKHVLFLGAATTAFGLSLAGPWIGVGFAVAAELIYTGFQLTSLRDRRTILATTSADGDRVEIRRMDAGGVQIAPGSGVDSFALLVPPQSKAFSAWPLRIEPQRLEGPTAGTPSIASYRWSIGTAPAARPSPRRRESSTISARRTEWSARW